MSRPTLLFLISLSLFMLTILTLLPYMHETVPQTSLPGTVVPIQAGVVQAYTSRCDLQANHCTLAGSELQGTSPQLQGESVPVTIQVAR